MSELRDPALARAFLLGGLALARVSPRVGQRDAAAWLGATLTETGALPPPGIVADVGALLLGGTLDPHALTPADDALGKALWAYEHQVLARLASERLRVLASDAVARLPERLVPAAIALTVGSVLQRIGFAGLSLPAGATRMLASVVPDEGATMLRAGLALDELRDGYARLVDCARATRQLWHEGDVFVLEHLDVLESLAQRVAMAQVLEAEDALLDGLPKRLPKRRPAGAIATAFEEEDNYPVGGFSSITTAGSLENLVTSELVYMDDDPSQDLFDVRFAEGELLYYTRDEASFVRRRRAVAFVLDPALVAARVRDPELPWQRSVVALAIVHAAIERLVAWLGEEELRFTVYVPDALQEERALLGLLLREQHERGLCEVHTGELPSARAWLEEARGLAQLVSIGGEAQVRKPIEAHRVDMTRADLTTYRTRMAELLRKLP